MPSPVRQAAALAVHEDRVCMVTSRSGRRWVIPKGRIDPGHTPTQAALIEAWEEAGLTGHLGPHPVGGYTYVKAGLDHHVLVYRMAVVEAREVWPERNHRRRAWLTPDAALERIEEPGLRDLIRSTFAIRGVPVG